MTKTSLNTPAIDWDNFQFVHLSTG